MIRIKNTNKVMSHGETFAVLFFIFIFLTFCTFLTLLVINTLSLLPMWDTAVMVGLFLTAYSAISSLERVNDLYQ